MDFKELTYVLAIAKYQGITKAAESLFLTQPTLTKFLQNLERDLHQKLFKKLGNRYVPTYAGERYIARAKEIISLKKELDDEMSDIIRSRTGSLKIACPAMRSTYLLPCTLPEFSRIYPNVQIHVTEAGSYELEDMLLSGETDLAFFNGPIKSPLIDCEVISHEEVVLVLSAVHPLAHTGVFRKECKYPWMDLQKMKDEEFILQAPHHRTWQTVQTLLHDCRLTPKVKVRTSNIQAAAELAAAGYGAYFITESHLKHMNLRNRLQCFSVGNPCTMVNFVAAFRKGSYITEYEKEYIRIVRDLT